MVGQVLENIAQHHLNIAKDEKQEDVAILFFTQSYRSNQLQSKVKKRLVAKKVLGVWKIVEERVVNQTDA